VIVRTRERETLAIAGAAPTSTLGDSVAAVPLQNVTGHRSQVAEQQFEETIPEAHAVAARKPKRAASPTSLRALMLEFSTQMGVGYSGTAGLPEQRGQSESERDHGEPASHFCLRDQRQSPDLRIVDRLQDGSAFSPRSGAHPEWWSRLQVTPHPESRARDVIP
jgi:hypothetical protein